MQYSPQRLFMVVVGLFIFATGIVLTINAGLGVSPWDVFHQGVSRTVGITIGQASITMGFLIILLDIYLGQAIGWATIMNMLLIGTFIDVLMLNNLIPVAETTVVGLVMIITGIVVQATGFAIYISQGIGAGPRDGLMVVLTRRSGKSVRLIKSIIDATAVSIGIILGGTFGIGTIIMAFFGGIIFQTLFRVINFKVEKVNHRFIQDDLKEIRNKA
ncbi:YczE/YyaS/YitT family protein [Gudongella sp. DL1XJH-153]|uniref:YczE/YyaS/YitT family protein n=1 Tax=Gudongella sp. DL1XJH-153 TaxID=3409804 RepID=UPI003BB5D46D